MSHLPFTHKHLQFACFDVTDQFIPCCLRNLDKRFRHVDFWTTYPVIVYYNVHLDKQIVFNKTECFVDWFTARADPARSTCTCTSTAESCRQRAASTAACWPGALFYIYLIFFILLKIELRLFTRCWSHWLQGSYYLQYFDIVGCVSLHSSPWYTCHLSQNSLPKQLEE